MTRRFVTLLVMAFSLLVTRQASAALITPVDLEDWIISGSIGDPVPGFPATIDTFDVAPPAVGSLGFLINAVFFNDTSLEYSYLEFVVPSANNAAFFNTGFDVPHFTGTAGWWFATSDAAGGCGGPGGSCPGDFIIQGEIGSGSPIAWNAFGDFFNEWDTGEVVALFYVSTRDPREGGNYNLTAGATGTAQSYAPTPEPGSMLLLGSGLATVYGAARRRRSQKSGSTAEIA
jgi:hypothetical protein